MPRADSVVLTTGLRFKSCVFVPLESRISCILTEICVAGRLCVEICFVRPFTAYKSNYTYGRSHEVGENVVDKDEQQIRHLDERGRGSSLAGE